jgi:uncharacterized RDD family membrane protein YckC
MSTEESRRAGGRVNPISFEDRVAIATPEGVEVELILAGIGSRFIAGAIDFTIQLVVIISLGLITRPAGDAGAAIFSSAAFAMIFFYDVLFEVLGRGRTPGKRWTGLRVVREGGRPITLARSALRNILRLIDILPGFYAVGMTTIFITSRNQRIGDLAAGTHVVRYRHGDQRRMRESGLLDIDPGPAVSWDVAAVSQDDVAAVRAFLERRYQLRAEHRVAIAGELASRLRPRVGGAPPDVGDESFLELLVAAKAARA